MRIQLYDHIETPAAGSPHDHFAPYLDSFLLPDAAAPLGAVIICPGGGYASRADHEGNCVAQTFNALGYHAFVLQYRVAPYRYPDALRDALRALRIVRRHAAEWNIDPEHIAISGFSAGAHLAASAALLGPRIPAEPDEHDSVSAIPNAMILCYPVIAASEPFAHRGSMIQLLGENPPESLLRQMDLHQSVTDHTPPAFLWHTADDPCVPVRNSISFAQAMWSCGNTCELHVFPHGSHGLGLASDFPDLAQWPAEAALFLEISAGFPRKK